MENKRTLVQSSSTENSCRRNWSDLFEDLLILIAGKLKFIEDIFAFSLVCDSWRSAASKEYNFLNGRRQFPWVLGGKHYNGTIKKTLLAFGQGKVYHADTILSNNFQSYNLGWKGWFLVLMDDETMYLQNMLVSKTRIKLPSKKSLQGFSFCHQVRAALSCDPFTNPSDFALAISYGNCEASYRLAFWRCGEKSYAHIESKAFIWDVIFHHGLLYAMTHQNVKVFGVAGPYNYPTFTIKNNYEIANHEHTIARYLVELTGRIVILTKINYISRGNIITRFRIFTPCRREIECLGNKAIFVGGVNQSFSLENATEIPECKPNHIYFFDYNRNENRAAKYNLANGTIEYLQCSLIREWRRCYPWIWISPPQLVS